MRDPFTLDRIIKALLGKLLDGTITNREQAELEHAQAERRQRLVSIPAKFAKLQQLRRHW